MSKTLITEELLSKYGTRDEYAARYSISQFWLCREPFRRQVSIEYKSLIGRWTLGVSTDNINLCYRGIMYMEDLVYSLRACGFDDIANKIK